MRRRDERGLLATAEAAIILPGLVLLVGLIIVLGRDALAQQAVGSAAQQGARAVSVERDASSGRAAAQDVVTASLSESGVECESSSLDVDASGLSAPFGSRASVSVTVSCTVDYAVSLPGLPDSRTISVTRLSPVDTYRSR